MMALRARAPGDPAALAIESAPVPTPGIGDALVRVRAASFTPTELGWPSTWVDRAGRDRRPAIPSHEVSGVVEALGYGTFGVAVGDPVYGLTDWYRDGAAAEYVAAEARNLAPKPATLDHVEAAAVPLAALTAWQALFDHALLATGQSVLISGAGGGVGVFAVQLAAAAGARVIGAGRGPAEPLVRELGAHAFLDLEREAPEAAGPVDVVLDLVGGEVASASWPALRAGGILVSIVEPPTPPSGSDVRAAFFVVEPDRPTLVELARRVDAGELRPVVGEVTPLREAAAVFMGPRAGGSGGKRVLVVD